MIFSKDEKFEEVIYEQVAQEIANGNINQGLWLKATIESGGNEFKAKANYAKLRMRQFKREIEDVQEYQIKVNEQRKIEQVAQLESRGIVICTKCKYKVIPITNNEVNVFMLILLSLLCIVPGMIYLALIGQKDICPNCKNEFKNYLKPKN